MKVRTIDFAKDGETPKAVTVTLTIREALYIAQVTGKQTGFTANQVLRDVGDELNTEIFGVTSSIFNTYWDDIDHAQSELL